MPVPLVVARRELRWIGRTACAAAVVTLAGGLVAPALTHVTALEAVVSALVFGISASSAVGSLVLGVRTGPSILYLRIFELAPAPPPESRGEPPRATAGRGIGAGLAASAGLALAAVLLLGATLALTGESQDALVKRVPVLSALVAGAWMLVLGVITLRVAAWFERWEARRGKVLVCPRLHSGMLRHVYYAAARADHAGPET
jgi:hypothetical protein